VVFFGYDLHGLMEGFAFDLREKVYGISRDVFLGPYPEVVF